MKQSVILILLILLTAKAETQTCEALFTFDQSNLTIQFTDLSTHATGDPIISWDWDFDDGGSSSQQNPIHTFPEPDRYDVLLTIQTQSGCVSEFEIRIEICDLDIAYTVGSCNAQGQVPVNLNITDIFNNAELVDIILDGQSVPGSPYLIDQQNPVSIQVLVPGNGLPHTIVVQSLGIETCGRTISFSTEDCSSDCFLSALSVNYAPGTTHTVTVDDNFFSPQSLGIVLGDIVQFAWAGGGHSTTSDAMSGPDSWNSGVIGAGSTFEVNIQNPGTHPYYCIPHGGQGGVGMSGQILSNCPSGTSINLQINFNTSIADGQGYNVFWDNVPVPGSPFSYNGIGPQSVTISIAGDSMLHQLILRDVADPTCDLEMIYTAPDCGQGGGEPVCMLTATLGNFGVCNNMIVTANLIVSVLNGGTGFNVSIDGGANTYYAYTGATTTIAINLPGDGANHAIGITDDVDPTCTASIDAITPDCNQPCSITNLTAVSSSGGGPSGITHTVNVEDFQFTPDMINITVGDVVEWNWTGAIAHTSTSDISSGVNSWSSGLLNTGAVYTSPLLEEGSHPYYCVPHGAPGGIGMSGVINVLPACNMQGQTTVLVQFDLTNGGASGYTILVDGTSAGTFSYVPGTAQSASILVEGDGTNHNIIVQDISDMTCTANVGVVTPDCSGGGNPSCMVSLSPAIIGGCINNMVPVLLNVTGTDTDTTYTVTVDGQAAGTFFYSNTGAQINLPGDGQHHIIIINDGIDTTCKDTAILSVPDCALPCTINNFTASTGLDIIHTIQVRDFDYFPLHLTIGAGEKIQFLWTGDIPHTVTSDALTGPEVWNSGLLGPGAVYNLIIDTPGIHPYFCIPHGGPGGIGMSGTITVLPACTDNQENVQLRFEALNASLQGYNLFIDGMLYGQNPRPYDDQTGLNEELIGYPADNAQHIITIQDINTPNCAASDFFTTDTCSASCQISSLEYNPGNARRHEILVRDFDYEPSSLQVDLGDTIRFRWTGAIPHTVSSDAASGVSVFNSGLLGQGSTYDLILSEIGLHPYYCIPHGAPGGIGMSGNIEVVDPCDDGSVFVDFEFFASGPGLSYDVLNHGNTVIADRPYVPGGIQTFTLDLTAQGNSHVIEVADNGQNLCSASIVLDSFDCTDPCFYVTPDYSYDVDYSTLQVVFNDQSQGQIISWNWDFGDGGTSTLQNPQHIFQEAVLYEVCLTITADNGCTEQVCDKLRLGADVCNASFTYAQQGLDIMFYNTSDVSDPAVTASWSFGDGGTSVQYDSTLHTFASGIYEVCITVTSSGCIDTHCALLDLSDSCLALQARYQAEVVGGNALLYQFSDLSSGPVGSYLWGFGDGQISSEANPSHLYAGIGVYTVCLLTIDIDGLCTNSDCRSLYVGTTSIDPNEIQLKKLIVKPNPADMWESNIWLSAFDSQDIGSPAVVNIRDINGVIVGRQQVFLSESVNVSTPQMPGLYYLQVVSGKNIYGAMVVVQ